MHSVYTRNNALFWMQVKKSDIKLYLQAETLVPVRNIFTSWHFLCVSHTLFFYYKIL